MTDRPLRSRQADAYDLAVGQRLRAARLQNGLSQTQLARSIGVTFQQIQKYENGATRITCSTLKQLSAALAVPMLSLLGESTAPEADALRVDPAVLRSAKQLQALPPANRRLVDALIQSLASGAPASVLA